MIRALVVAIAIAAFARAEQVRACGGWAYNPAEGLTFDPHVLDGVDDNLLYEPYMAGFGATGCANCNHAALLADWHGYLRESGMSDADWERILFSASDKELAQLATKWKSKDKVAAAIAYVRLARRVEPFASLDVPKAAAESADVLADAKAALGKTKDPFLAQRYAFQVMRVLFYQHDWPGAIAWFDANAAGALKGPSSSLLVEARYYTAGALLRTNKLGRGNLELARVHAADPAFAAAAAQDFRPANDKDWKESLSLARDTADKVALWRLVGMRHDGVAAMQEIVKLDPKSPLLALLMVREMSAQESGGKPVWAPLEQIASTVIAKGGDRTWLMELALGHIAARKGELAHAREHLQKARDAAPKNPLVAMQVNASLSIALAANWRIDGAHEDELAKTMAGVAKTFQNYTALRTQVREQLARLYLAAGRPADAEMLSPGTVDKWNQLPFIKDMIARASKTSSDFDKFVLADTLTPQSIQQDLALRYLLDGDFVASANVFATTNATSEKLGTDPFVIHIIDCHDCDHEKYANAAWTHATVVRKLVDLAKIASNKDEAAADASIQIGIALYNITYWGNARSMLDGSHQQTRNASAALKWFKRAYDLTANRETKAKAAFLAAKAELGNALEAAPDGVPMDPLPVPATWFPLLRKLDDTKYYKDVIAECGSFRKWASTHK